MADRLTFSNTYCRPPITVVCTISPLSSTGNSIQYLDPDDNTPYMLASLNWIERGAVFQYRNLREDAVRVHMPVRIMGNDLMSYLRTYKSFRSLSPRLNVHRIPEENEKNIRSCLQDFLLSKDDFARFLLNKNFVFQNRSTTSASVTQWVNTELEKLSVFFSEVRELRIRVSTVSTEEEFQQISSELGALEKNIKVFTEVRSELTELIKMVEEEDNNPTEKLLAEREAARFTEAMRELASIDPLALSSELVQNFSRNTGTSIPSFVLTLGEELSRLARYYPVLKLLQCKSDQITLSLSGVKIILNNNNIHIEGDLERLKPYLGYSEKIQETEKPNRSGRVKGLDIKE